MTTREQVIEAAERLRRLTPDEIEHYELTPIPSEEEVRAKVADYRSRVEALFRDIEGWIEADGRYLARRGDPVFLYERLMALYDLDDAEVPTLSISNPDGVEVICLCPDQIWVTFTNGRVAVDTPRVPLGIRRHDMRLVDKGEPFGPACWMLRGARKDVMASDEFDRAAFLKLLSESDVAI